MKRKLIIALVGAYTLMLSHSAWAEAKFNIAPSGKGKIGEGRCHMSYCSWSKIISNKIVHQSSEKTRVKTSLIGGSSYHRNDYPPSGKIPKNIKWNKKPHTVTVVCSYVSPQVIIDGQVDELDFQALPAILWSSANLYFEVCHNYYGGFSNGAEKFGYE